VSQHQRLGNLGALIDPLSGNLIQRIKGESAGSMGRPVAPRQILNAEARRTEAPPGSQPDMSPSPSKAGNLFRRALRKRPAGTLNSFCSRSGKPEASDKARM